MFYSEGASVKNGVNYGLNNLSVNYWLNNLSAAELTDYIVDSSTHVVGDLCSECLKDLDKAVGVLKGKTASGTE